MILIPLETRTFDGEERFHLDLVLDKSKEYEIAVFNAVFLESPDYFCEITCDAINPTIFNPRQILYRYYLYDVAKNVEYYKLDTYNLRTITLTLTGSSATPIAITLAIREVDAAN